MPKELFLNRLFFVLFSNVVFFLFSSNINKCYRFSVNLSIKLKKVIETSYYYYCVIVIYTEHDEFVPISIANKRINVAVFFFFYYFHKAINIFKF